MKQLNTNQIMKDKLNKLAGQQVRIVAGDDCSDDNGIYFHFVGKLELPEEGNNRYFVRVSDGYHGTDGLGFHVGQVEFIDKGVYLHTITMKQNLRANAF